MASVNKRLDVRAGHMPDPIRFVVAPILWRLTVGLFWTAISFCVIQPDSLLWDSNYLDDLDEVFKTLSGVFGVLAAFVSTSVTVIYTSDSSGARRMRSKSKNALPRKLIYSTVTLLILAFLLALFATDSVSPKILLALLASAVSLALIETVTVSMLTLSAIDETTEQPQPGRDPD